MSECGMKLAIVVLSVILLSSYGCYGSNVSCEDLTYRVVRALDGALGFFAREYDQVNLDAVVGVRMAQSQLQAALAELEFDKNPELKVFQNELEKLCDKAETICDQAIPVVKRQYPKDYRDLGLLVSGNFWNSGAVQKRQTDASQASYPQPAADWEPLNEPLTDRCISQLLGIKGSEPCSITSFCWLAMTPRGYRSYSLSHQVLYLTVGAMMGCEFHIMKRFHRPEMTTEDGSVLDSLMDGFCSDILREAETTADRGYPPGSQDLFMEQVLLCGLKGYEDFFKLPWLQAVLSWQDESGCYTDGVYRPRADDEDHADPVVGGPRYIRERRREKQVNATGCLMHKTSVGAGFLSIYLRMLMETMAKAGTETNCLGYNP